MEGMKNIEQAFKRHERPQEPSLPRLNFPTAATLVAKAASMKFKQTESGGTMAVASQENSAGMLLTHTPPLGIEKSSPWLRYTPLGELVQVRSRLELCVTKKGTMAMLKRMSREDGHAEFEVLNLLSHSNIIGLRDSFLYKEQVFLGLDYYRHTLEEVLNVPLKVEEIHIQNIAYSVFSAIQFVAQAGFVHNRVGLQTIRLCNKTGKLVLSNFQGATKYRSRSIPNTDLENLGLVLIQSMSGSATACALDVNTVREQRRVNRLYGVQDAEDWSHCQLLIDFLDELFSKEKMTSLKLEKAHPFITKEAEGNPFEAHIELVPLSCFTLWYPQS